ncbi:MAG: L-aspartate oxidase [Deltaproteobacteria bacterium]|nr:L-aspartate oxidase [Deltaproteobacteria bacterium]
MHRPEDRFDVVIVGGGIAGFSLALDLAEQVRVCVLAKGADGDTNTRWAQGGIAAVLGDDDSFDAHVEDTLVAGAGLCREEEVRRIVEAGPAAIAELLARGVSLDKADDGGLQLTREGGHSARRIAHAHDHTGLAIQDALGQRVREHGNIELREHHLAVDLITRAKVARGRGVGQPGGRDDRVLGVYALDVAAAEVHAIAAPVVVLATGGAGRCYLYTSNPGGATGDGVAMAYRAGARVANMEFFQFHPTALYHPERKNFLVSEALRGEGGILRTADGDAFMARYHPLQDLAPRDIVARAIDRELKTRGDASVYLDMTHLPPDFLVERFPTIHRACMEVEIDMRRQPIPVVPAAHYMCGGVQVDADCRTTISGLLAIGEVSCSGLHGANRLASNSLLEAAVQARRAAATATALLEQGARAPHLDVPSWDVGEASSPDERVLMNQAWDEIRRLMWNYVGIVRSNRRLIRAKRRLELIYGEVREEYWRFFVSPETVELRNLATVAQLIVDSALIRQESRGLHFSLDYPDTDDDNWRHDTVLRRPLSD